MTCSGLGWRPLVEQALFRVFLPHNEMWRKYRRLNHTGKHPTISLEVAFATKSPVA